MKILSLTKCIVHLLRAQSSHGDTGQGSPRPPKSSWRPGWRSKDAQFVIQGAGTAPGRWRGQTFCGGGGFGAGGWEGSTLRGVGDAKDGRRPESSRVKIRLVLKKNNIDFLKLRRINYNKKIDSHWISEIYPFKLQGIITTCSDDRL